MTRKRSPSPVARNANPAGAGAYRRALLAWYAQAARDLPWRRDRDPYRVWVSEAMLQQTRVETVIPYYVRFLERFPDVGSLALASEEAVLEAWSGLGYYRRARLLHAGARRVVQEFGGRVPDDEPAVRSLPGVGRYTAGAILSIAFGRAAPIVDGNVARVLSRVFGVAGDVSKSKTSRELWALAARAVEAGDPGAVNQAQMELGALVCFPVRPRCDSCPCASFCIARRDGRIVELPQLPAKRAVVEVRRAALLVQHEGRVLLRRRLEGEISPGMWDLPGSFTGNGGDRALGLEDAKSLVPFAVRIGAKLGEIRHGVTYRRILLEVHAAAPARRIAQSKRRAPDGAELAWHGVLDADDRALSSPARRALRKWAAPGR